MKNLIRFSTFLLILSGLLLTPILLQGNTLATGTHILLGFVYAVLFLLFCVDHVNSHRENLGQLDRKNIAGVAQILLGVLVLGSGFILYLYGSEPLTPLTEIHLGGTILFLISTSAHFFFRD